MCLLFNLNEVMDDGHNFIVKVYKISMILVVWLKLKLDTLYTLYTTFV